AMCTTTAPISIRKPVTRSSYDEPRLRHHLAVDRLCPARRASAHHLRLREGALAGEGGRHRTDERLLRRELLCDARAARLVVDRSAAAEIQAPGGPHRRAAFARGAIPAPSICGSRR